jgi:hypothetical protein
LKLLELNCRAKTIIVFKIAFNMQKVEIFDEKGKFAISYNFNFMKGFYASRPC